MITNPCNGRLTVGKATVYVQNVNSYVESSDTPAFGLTSQRVTVKFAKFDPLIRQLLFIHWLISLLHILLLLFPASTH